MGSLAAHFFDGLDHEREPLSDLQNKLHKERYKAIQNQTMVSENNNLVYIKTQNETWSPAKLLEQNDKTALVEQENGERVEVDLSEYRSNALPQQNVDDQGKLIETEDMANLSYLHEVRRLLEPYHMHS